MNLNMAMWRVLDQIETSYRLNRLPYSVEARYRAATKDGLAREVCTPNTRVNVLDQLKHWTTDTRNGGVFWLNGMAGTGKTTISASLCEYLESTQRLAASFFCSRQLPTCRDINKIIPSISYQLTAFSLPFRFALSRVLERDPDAYNQAVTQQYAKLVAEPLNRAACAIPDNLIIAIDALDECDNVVGIRQILDALLSDAWQLPLRFFIASRPEPYIMSTLRRAKGSITELRLHEMDPLGVNADIRVYLNDRLRHTNISSSGLEALACQSGALFIYAATAVHHLGSFNFSTLTRLPYILNSSHASTNYGSEGLNNLYTHILGAAFHNSGLRVNEQMEMGMLLQTVIYAQQPMTVDVISEILTLDKEDSVLPLLQHLLSVLRIYEPDGLVTILHESFLEHRHDQSRSQEFWRDPYVENGRLAQQCAQQLISSELCFHICESEPSHLAYHGIGNQLQTVRDNITAGLIYACCHLANHLELAKPSQPLIDALSTLVATRLVLWIEVLNLIGRIDVATQALDKLFTWCEKTNCLKAALSLNEYYSSFGYAYLLSSRHCSDSLSGLDKSIDQFGRALAIAQRRHPNAPLYLNYLGKAGTMVFKLTHEIGRLTEATESLCHAVDLCPSDHPCHPEILENLGFECEALYELTEESNDIRSAAILMQQATELVPNKHPDKARYLLILARIYLRLSGAETYAETWVLKAQSTFEEVAWMLTGCLYYRLQGAILWAHLSKQTGNVAFETYTLCFGIIPNVLHQHTDPKHNWLAKLLRDFTGQAVALAISVDKYQLSAQWFELGRQRPWGSNGYNNTSLREVAEHHQRLVNDRAEAQRTLERPADIQALPHSWNGLGSISHLRADAVVVINVNPDRCDALVIRPWDQTISNVPLEISYEDIRALSGQRFSRHDYTHRGIKYNSGPKKMVFQDTLTMLWHKIIRPVLAHLEISHPKAVEDLPHIIWCPAGPLASLPLHAAGDYTKPDTVLSNVAISSFTPSLSCLVRSASCSTPFSGILTVGHDLDRLPGARSELDGIKEKFELYRCTRLEEGDADPDRVLKAMADHSWVHFSCMASQDCLDPLKSALHLHNKNLDLVSMAKFPLKSAQFAYLSACQTAAGDETLPDEAMHLAAGLLMAGYSSVIAATDVIYDKDANYVAHQVYEYMLDGGIPDYRKSAMALHKAISNFREIVGIENYERWVPYVHFGC
ncbi:CHAT domain protein [Ceratobasidium sp. AG-Ba]|nr:CHAT domain protein [Ceratobasidium sp. AG-Ba]QRW15474.1 CHAT domain protein [Ceratobasidium sp. AG-Ba]